MVAIPGALDRSAQDETSPPERRGPPRKRVLIPAIVEGRRGVEYRCVIRDISATGAKIGIARGNRLPKRFRLVTGSRPEGYPVRLVWQRGNFAGVTLDLPEAE